MGIPKLCCSLNPSVTCKYCQLKYCAPCYDKIEYLYTENIRKLYMTIADTVCICGKFMHDPTLQTSQKVR